MGINVRLVECGIAYLVSSILSSPLCYRVRSRKRYLPLALGSDDLCKRTYHVSLIHSHDDISLELDRDKVSAVSILSLHKNFVCVTDTVQHLLESAYSDSPDSYKNDPDRFARSLRRAMDRTVNAVNSVEMMQSWHGCNLGYPASTRGLKRKMPVERFRLDELHLRAVLAALIAEKGPVPLSEFSMRIMFFGEESIQKRKDAFLGTPLDPPKTSMSGHVFAAAAMKAYKAMEDPELHSQSAG